MTELKKVVVTRHQALVKWLKLNGYIDDKTEHISHASIKDIEGKHVFGILPNWLACHAAMLTEVQLRLPVEKRGAELTLKEIEFFAVKPQTYIIKLMEVENEKSS